MPAAIVIVGLVVTWYFGIWPFDRHSEQARDTAYVAEVGYYAGDEIRYDTGSRQKTLAACRSEADSFAAYRGRNSPSRVVSQSCLVFINGQADHRE